MNNARHLKFEFRWNHRLCVLYIEPKRYRFSLYKHPFISFRFLCFWFVWDFNPIGVPLNTPPSDDYSRSDDAA